MHKRKMYQLGNKVIGCFTLKVSIAVMISLEGNLETVQSMTS